MGRFLRSPLFSKPGILTVELISSPSPLYLRRHQSRAVINDGLVDRRMPGKRTRLARLRVRRLDHCTKWHLILQQRVDESSNVSSILTYSESREVLADEGKNSSTTWIGSTHNWSAPTYVTCPIDFRRRSAPEVPDRRPSPEDLDHCDG